MQSVASYSSLFSCLYDEKEPIGSLGRGAHYSVMRAVEWLDATRQPLQWPEVHDFAVIWDEDHDTRIVNAVERIYMSGFLSPVQFIGERKGTLYVIVNARFYFTGSDRDTETYRRDIEGMFSGVHGVDGDSWPVVLGSFDRNLGSPAQTIPNGIIHSSEDKVITYLRNIDNLWSLGTKSFQQSGLHGFKP